MREAISRDAVLARPGVERVSSHEQRRAPRFTLLIRAAKLISPEGEFMCIVRDASETGLNIRLFHALPECNELLLELQNGDQHEVGVVWQEQERAGLQFVGDADIARIVECPSRFAKRPIRVNLEAQAVLSSGSGQIDVQLNDISQQGARIKGDHFFAIDERVRIAADGLPEVNAKVRWRKQNAYGLVFEDTFQFGDLARIVAGIQLGLPSMIMRSTLRC